MQDLKRSISGSVSATKDIYEVKDKFHFFLNLEQFYFTIVQYKFTAITTICV